MLLVAKVSKAVFRGCENVSSYVTDTGPNKENKENYVRKRLINFILHKLLSEWMDHVAFTRWKINAYKILVKKTEENN